MKFIIMFVNFIILSIFFCGQTNAEERASYGTVQTPTNSNSMPLTHGGPSIQKIIPGLATHADGLFYNDDCLTYVDRKTGTGYIWMSNGTLDSWRHSRSIHGENLAFIYPIEGSKEEFLLGSDANLRILSKENNGSFSVTKRTNVTNDKGFYISKAHADKNGILFLTVNSKFDKINRGARLYKFENGTVTLVEKYYLDLGDFAFSPDYSKMYLVVDGKFKIVSYDYDINSGKISNKKYEFNLTKSEVYEGCHISGLESDNNDHIWASVAKGGYVISISTNTKKVTNSINMPSKELTSITFGGPELQGIFVGTSKGCHHFDAKKSGVYYISGLNSAGMPDKDVAL